MGVGVGADVGASAGVGASSRKRKRKTTWSESRECLKNSFPVFLGRIASDFSLPKCKLDFEVKGNMLISPYLVVDPIPAQNEWSQVLGKKND